MLYTVEVKQIGGDIVAFMKEMRTWFDHCRVEPDAFRHSIGGAEITYRVDFKKEPEAVGFARAFRGRLVSLPAARAASTDPLWPSTAAARAFTGGGLIGGPDR